jgi:cytoskeletal protein CcmA (bactofilin family)
MSFWTNNKQEPAAANGGPATILTTEQAHEPPQETPMPMITAKRDEAPAAAGSSTSDLALGEGAEFEGKLTFKGTVRIDSIFKGSIVTNDVLILGEHAKVDAEITCGTVIVHGQVNGNIKAKSAVELQRTARVRGDIETLTIVVEKGAFFDGSVRMNTAERGASAKPAAASPLSA